MELIKDLYKGPVCACLGITKLSGGPHCKQRTARKRPVCRHVCMCKRGSSSCQQSGGQMAVEANPTRVRMGRQIAQHAAAQPGHALE